jgi:hypothetical protein
MFFNRQADSLEHVPATKADVPGPVEDLAAVHVAPSLRQNLPHQVSVSADGVHARLGRSIG